jgi:hypothetical protein
MKRRSFIQSLSAIYASAGSVPAATAGEKPLAPEGKGRYSPGRIANEYSLFLPGEREALASEPSISRSESGTIRPALGKWKSRCARAKRSTAGN